MLIGSQTISNKFPAAGSAKLDRELVRCDRKNWLGQLAGKMRIAIFRRIPVGFEDETGFHLGVQMARKDESMEWERAGFLEEQEQF